MTDSLTMKEIERRLGDAFAPNEVKFEVIDCKHDLGFEVFGPSGRFVLSFAPMPVRELSDPKTLDAVVAGCRSHLRGLREQ